ncbi:MAG: CPXCG motif-containing cysteine-rich protein [candidate division Zixibacteria bacterium]|nr:CPXCG motif-containing cysteine-rich protein [candidate division Zixibacteria bacterium]
MMTTYTCAYCGEINDLFIDPSGGDHQEFIEDCQICCRPNLLKMTGNAEADVFTVTAEVEG